MGPEIALISTVAGGLFKVIGSVQESRAAAQAAQYQAQVDRNNAVVAQQNAAFATQAGAAKAEAQDMQTRARLGGIFASQGASGFDTADTSSRELRDAARNVGRLDAETVYTNALLDARNDVAQSSSYSARANLADFRASSASSAGTLNAFSSLIGTASSFSDKWNRFREVGVY